MLAEEYMTLFDNYMYAPSADKLLKHEWMLRNKMRSGVYVMFDKELQPLYVGQTKNLMHRLAEHYHDGVLSKWADRFAFLAFKECRDRGERIALEERYIKQLRPELNVVHNRG